MTPSFTRAEYWLLEAAVEDSVIIAETGNGDAAQRLNRFDHGVTRNELVDAFDRLLADGLIMGISIDLPTDSARRMQLTRAQIEFELSRPTEHYCYDDGMVIDGFPEDASQYELTVAGGAAWEAFAQPDWDRYIGDFCSLNDEDMTGEAICISKKWLERYLWSDVWRDWKIVSESARWDVLQPWPATYWKSFASAHRVQFRILRKEESLDAHTRNTWSWSLEQMRRWYRWHS